MAQKFQYTFRGRPVSALRAAGCIALEAAELGLTIGAVRYHFENALSYGDQPYHGSPANGSAMLTVWNRDLSKLTNGNVQLQLVEA